MKTVVSVVWALCYSVMVKLHPVAIKRMDVVLPSSNLYIGVYI